MSTHNVCFCRVIRKLFTWYPLLSRPMVMSSYYSVTLLLIPYNFLQEEPEFNCLTSWRNKKNVKTFCFWLGKVPTWSRCIDKYSCVFVYLIKYLSFVSILTFQACLWIKTFKSWEDSYCLMVLLFKTVRGLQWRKIFPNVNRKSYTSLNINVIWLGSLLAEV